jgi:hypothetical protein
MSYKITKKIKPKGADFILFNAKNETSGIVNFNDMKLKSLDDVNKIVVNDELIEINFPIFDHYFTMEYKSKNGWTLKKLLMAIHKTAVCAGQYLVQYQPQLFTEKDPTPADFVDKYFIGSNGKKSDLLKKNNNIYVNINIIIVDDNNALK